MNDMLRITMIDTAQLVADRAPIPTPANGEVLIRVIRVGVCGSDPTIYHGRHPYAKKPLVMGHEFSGIVERCGSGVTAPAVGTRVTIIPHLTCGHCDACQSETYNFCEELRCMGAEADGAHTEFICVPADRALPIPDTMSLDAAAMIEPACVAYHGVRRGEITTNDTALVIGAGPIGNFAMQSSLALGAKAVIVADIDAWRLELASKLGATATINLANESLDAGLTRLLGSSKRIDVFYDCVGREGTVLDQILAIARRGTRIVVIGVLETHYALPHLPDFVQHELRLSGTTMYVPQDYRDMIHAMSTRQIRIDGMITHRYPLADLQNVFDFIDSRREPFFKIMLDVANDPGVRQ